MRLLKPGVLYALCGGLTPWLPSMSSYGHVASRHHSQSEIGVAFFGSSFRVVPSVRHWQSHNSSKGPRFPRSSPPHYNFLLTLFLCYCLFFRFLDVSFCELLKLRSFLRLISDWAAQLQLAASVWPSATAGSPDSGSEPMPDGAGNQSIREIAKISLRIMVPHPPAIAFAFPAVLSDQFLPYLWKCLTPPVTKKALQINTTLKCLKDWAKITILTL